jgi:hypothetical protein
MFGLEGHKKKKNNEEFVFDLEHDLKIPEKRLAIKKKVEERLQQVKDILRSGENKEEFDQCGVMLHGYASLLKIISRFALKKD